MPPISACVITLNEEDNIRRILDSLVSFSEIIILDSGSIDNTLTIATTYKNVKIYTRPFDNYINQKNHCISLSSNRWVISLDADERVSPSLKNGFNKEPFIKNIGHLFLQ
ncbi:MAG: glycosyltransferase [Chitinophagia bacterium]|nr:glycosyltransferase [Chitinophagia bacterium]